MTSVLLDEISADSWGAHDPIGAFVVVKGFIREADYADMDFRRQLYLPHRCRGYVLKLAEVVGENVCGAKKLLPRQH